MTNLTLSLLPQRGSTKKLVRNLVLYTLTVKEEMQEETVADTYTQLYIHFVFVVKNRMSLIHP